MPSRRWIRSSGSMGRTVFPVSPIVCAGLLIIIKASRWRCRWVIGFPIGRRVSMLAIKTSALNQGWRTNFIGLSKLMMRGLPTSGRIVGRPWAVQRRLIRSFPVGTTLLKIKASVTAITAIWRNLSSRHPLLAFWRGLIWRNDRTWPRPPLQR